MKQETKAMTGLFVVDVTILAFGIFGPVLFGFHPLKALSLATASIGLLTFLAFFGIAYEPGLVIERAMRNSIAASVIVMYLATIGIVTFWPAESTAAPELNPLTKTMIDSFQTVVTVVIGFYFASSAVIEAVQRHKTGSV